ncbi:MAG: PAS domain-containing sensor histidine kinase [Chloroflexota bacterium]
MADPPRVGAEPQAAEDENEAISRLRQALAAALRREQALRNECGELTNALDVEGDVTALRQAEARLREANQTLQMYARLVESSPDLIAVLDRDYRYRLVNATFTSLRQLTAAAVVGKSLAEVVGEEVFTKTLRPQLERCFAGETVRFEGWFDYAEQGRHYMEIHYFPVWGQGHVEYAAVILRDITDRRRAEVEREHLLAQLREEQLRVGAQGAAAARQAAQLRALLESLGEAVIVADATGQMLLCNRQAEAIGGPPNAGREESLTQRVAARTYYPDGKPMPTEEQALATLLRGEAVQGQEVVVLDGDGERRHLLVTGSAVRDEQGAVELAIIVHSDITALRRLEKAREEFVALAAHELRTPLTALKGYAQLMRRTGGHNEQEEQAFRAFGTQTDRISRIVQAMLDVTELQRGELLLQSERLNLADLVAGEVAVAAADATAHRFKLQITARPTVAADPTRLRLVVTQLLDNAVKYSPKGGPIDVTVAATASEATVVVRDRGIGMAPEQQKRLFQAFFQATPMLRPTTGLGLGLFISQEIVRRHGGRMWLASTPGRGSTFGFALPLAD